MASTGWRGCSLLQPVSCSLPRWSLHSGSASRHQLKERKVYNFSDILRCRDTSIEQPKIPGSHSVRGLLAESDGKGAG